MKEKKETIKSPFSFIIDTNERKKRVVNASNVANDLKAGKQIKTIKIINPPCQL